MLVFSRSYEVLLSILTYPLIAGDTQVLEKTFHYRQMSAGVFMDAVCTKFFYTVEL